MGGEPNPQVYPQVFHVIWTYAPAFAACVVSVLAALTSVACVRYAIRLYADSKAALNRAGTTSLRAELDEMRDAFEKNSALLKRINSRTIMQERRENAGGNGSGDDRAQKPGETPEAWKARMRKSLLVAGKPAKHG